jgi:hypothetical protein
LAGWNKGWVVALTLTLSLRKREFIFLSQWERIEERENKLKIGKKN